jgi:spore coat protein U-like protein
MKSPSKVLKQVALAAVAISAGLAMSTISLAGGTTPLTVNAKILGVCKVTATPGTLDFGTIDPSGAANVTATTTFSMKCSKGTTSTANTDDNGLNFSASKRMQHTVAGNYLSYAIAYTNDVGFAGGGFGGAAVARIMTINGTITPAQYADAMATTGVEVYADTVTITVNP